jgi:hypothetical protein
METPLYKIQGVGAPLNKHLYNAENEVLGTPAPNLHRTFFSDYNLILFEIQGVKLKLSSL